MNGTILLQIRLLPVILLSSLLHEFFLWTPTVSIHGPGLLQINLTMLGQIARVKNVTHLFARNASWYWLFPPFRVSLWTANQHFNILSIMERILQSLILFFFFSFFNDLTSLNYYKNTNNMRLRDERGKKIARNELAKMPYGPKLRKQEILGYSNN